MGVRAMWKGIIRFGSVAVPVKLYAAIESRRVNFRLLHKEDQIPVSQKMVNPVTGQVVPYEAVRRGYETPEGEIVLLDEDELAALEPQASREITVTRFVDRDRIDFPWYDRPYYMGPDTDHEAYFALAKALEGGKKEGLARWNMRKKSYIGALRAENGLLELITLRHTGEIVNAAQLPRPEGRPLKSQEIQMAEQLVRALEGDLDLAEYRDEYRERLQELVEAKARGETLKLKKPVERKPKVVSLSDLLKQSVKKAKEERKIA